MLLSSLLLILYVCPNTFSTDNIKTVTITSPRPVQSTQTPALTKSKTVFPVDENTSAQTICCERATLDSVLESFVFALCEAVVVMT